MIYYSKGPTKQEALSTGRQSANATPYPGTPSCQRHKDKLRPREVKQVAENQAQCKWQSWGLNPGSLTPEQGSEPGHDAASKCLPCRQLSFRSPV